MPRPGRKAITPKSNPKSNLKLDTYHNRFDQPCCRFLQEIKDEILKPTESNSLASAIQNYLQTEAAGNSVSENKKRKKKRKKKKASSDEKAEDADDGKVESIDTPEPVESVSRRKRLLYNYLAKSNQNSNSCARPPQSLKPFVEYLTQKPVRCKVQPGAVRQAVHDIACEACRNSVQEHLNKNSMLVLNFGGVDDEQPEAHFDYVAMEEGLGQEKERWYFVRDSSSPSHLRGSGYKELDEGTWELCYSAASSRDESEESSNPWKWEHFLFFLENGILLPALSIDDVLGFDQVDKVLPKTLVKDIMERVYRFCERKELSFCQWARQLANATSTFEEQTSMHHVGGNIEMSSFAIMKSTDETCQQLLCNIFTIMWEMTQHTISVIQFSQQYLFCDAALNDEATEEERKMWSILRAQRQADHDSSATFVKLLELWHEYSKAIESIAVESTAYEKKVEEQSNAQGSIPAMYCSAEMRELYRRLVRSKVRAIYHLIDSFQTQLDSEVNLLDPLLGRDAAWNVSWYRYLIAQKTYQETLRGLQGKRKKKNGSTLSFDEMLETVMIAVSKWITESIHQGTVQRLLLEHDQRRRDLCGQVKKLLETGERHFAHKTSEAVRETSSSSVLNELKGLLDDLLEGDHAGDISSIDRGDAILKTAALRSTLWKRSVTLISNWLHCSVSFDLEKISVQKYDYGWLTLASTSELPFIVKKELFLQQTGRFEDPCLGGNSKFRVECILLGLLFRWMDERYKEWQAVVAEQELLIAMSEENVQAPPKAIVGKKSKKKKPSGKKGGAELQRPGGRVPEAAQSMENAPDSASATSVGTDISETGLDQAWITPPVKQPEQLHPSGLSNQNINKKEPTEEESIVTSDNGSAKLVNIPAINTKEESSIGLLDDGKFQSAEDFLVGRLIAVMRSPASTTFITG